VARERISMTRDEVRAYLAQERWMVLGTLDPDGGPFADAVRCALDGERLAFAVPRAGRSAANLRRDARACCSSDRFASYYEIRGVTVHGRAERVVDEALRVRLAAALAAPEGPARGAAEAESELYALPLDDFFGFDFAKIREKF
jgi:nitroimidazol reductase NimA-like FMN-containing flavoprotein (pyridoxamine 5'-phosphate oxidase superfamily)